MCEYSKPPTQPGGAAARRTAAEAVQQADGGRLCAMVQAVGRGREAIPDSKAFGKRPSERGGSKKMRFIGRSANRRIAEVMETSRAIQPWQEPCRRRRLPLTQNPGRRTGAQKTWRLGEEESSTVATCEADSAKHWAQPDTSVRHEGVKLGVLEPWSDRKHRSRGGSRCSR